MSEGYQRKYAQEEGIDGAELYDANELEMQKAATAGGPPPSAETGEAEKTPFGERREDRTTNGATAFCAIASVACLAASVGLVIYFAFL